MMNSLEDTIAAVATPPGEGGIGIVRLSGSSAISIVQCIFEPSRKVSAEIKERRTMLHGHICDPLTAEKVDEVLVTFMKGPRTYTCEDVAEINCHGGSVPLRRILRIVLANGARIAEPGEFTKRAFLNGRMDLSQAEAVIDIIRATTDSAERVAMQQLEGRLSAEITAERERIANLCTLIEAYLDFPEDEVEAPDNAVITEVLRQAVTHLAGLSRSYEEGRLYRDGAAMAIAGRPNVGKSSLMNALLKKDRAIVTDMPGTTRDIIEEGLNIKGMPLRIMDTAGIREAHDLAEAEGVRRSLAAIDGADIILAVFDSSSLPDAFDLEVLTRISDKTALIVLNKSDIASDRFVLPYSTHRVIRVSAKTGAGLDDLRDAISESLLAGVLSEGDCGKSAVLVSNLRHKQLIDRAICSVESAAQKYNADEPLEVVAMFLREALDSLGEIVGAVTTEDILNRIFNEFCIGK